MSAAKGMVMGLSRQSWWYGQLFAVVAAVDRQN